MKLKSIYAKYKLLIPLVVLTWYGVMIVITFLGGLRYDGTTYTYANLTFKQLFAVIFIGISWIAFFLFRPYYKYVFVITILLGIFNLIIFTPTSVKVGIAINKIELWFQPVVLAAALIAFIVSFKDVFPNYSKPSEQVSHYHQQKTEEEVNAFKNAYKNKSSDFLVAIIQDKRYTAAATEAAQQLLTERKESQQHI